MADTIVTYRVTSITEQGPDYVTVNFVEVHEPDPSTPQAYGTFSRTFPANEAHGYFPGQTYTMTLAATA